VLELAMTWLLMLVILCVSDGGKERGLMAGLAIGAVVGLEAMFGGPISGASMNPARSLGPALVSGRTEPLWLYALAPILGAMAAVPMCRWIRAPGCCAGDEACA
jgi:aquaporin Z